MMTKSEKAKMSDVEDYNFRTCLDNLKKFLYFVKESNDLKAIKERRDDAQDYLDLLDGLVGHLNLLQYHLRVAHEEASFSPSGCNIDKNRPACGSCP